MNPFRGRFVTTTMFACFAIATMAGQGSFGSAAMDLYRLARRGAHYSTAQKLPLKYVESRDGRSFSVIYTTTEKPEKWIVSLHGSNGFATDDVAIWSRHLAGRKVGLICVQWWLGTGDSTRDYYSPLQIYPEIDRLLTSVGAKPGSVALHGFSRGSANSYALAAIDRGRGGKWFGLCVASSGGVSDDYPPTAGIDRGDYGDQPLEGTKWITAAGERDMNPERDGVPGMRRTARWLRDHKANVLFSIEDPRAGHGALVTNPKNAAKFLDAFLG